MNNTSEDRGFKELPLGEIVENTTAAQIPASKLYLGKFVSLQPVDPEKEQFCEPVVPRPLKQGLFKK